MADILITITISAPARALYKQVQHEVDVPVAYGEADYQNFAAHAIERAAERLIQNEGWRAPLRHALLANDARASRIEQLANAGSSVSSADILAVFNTDSESAIAQWGSPPIEE